MRRFVLGADLPVDTNESVNSDLEADGDAVGTPFCLAHSEPT